jgi:hypothetical protein
MPTPNAAAYTAFDSIWLSDNVGDVVYRVPLHMK